MSIHSALILSKAWSLTDINSLSRVIFKIKFLNDLFDTMLAQSFRVDNRFNANTL